MVGCNHSRELELVRLIKTGNRMAENEFANMTYGRLHSWVSRSFGADLMTTDDIVQATYERAIPALRTFREECQPYSWLCTIACNIVYDLSKKAKSRPAHFSIGQPSGADDSDDRSVLDPKAIGKSPIQIASDQEISSRVRAALERVSERRRTIIELRYFAGLEYEDIAEAMGISKGGVKSNLYNAKSALAAELPAKGITPEIAADFLSAA